MKITYTENATGRHTEVSHADANGHPVASRFAGWWQANEIEAQLAYNRKHDRNRVQK